MREASCIEWYQSMFSDLISTAASRNSLLRVQVQLYGESPLSSGSISQQLSLFDRSTQSPGHTTLFTAPFPVLSFSTRVPILLQSLPPPWTMWSTKRVASFEAEE